MNDEKKCPDCGKPVSPDALMGLCPECLLKTAGKQTEAPAPAAPAVGPRGTVVVNIPLPEDEIKRLFPNLDILECLGRGGMGVVYKARQPKLDRFVALKIIAYDKAEDKWFADRFTREARTLAKLNHPNIITIYDFGEVEGRFFLLMEFVDGLNLRQLLQTGKTKPEEVLAIIPRICEALQFAHDYGVVHRDIKPENIMVDKTGRVKIADFGIAKIVGGDNKTKGLTGEQQIIGTPNYMAPEQVERPLQVDHRADIYSLGVVFYEMLTGELPLGRFQPPSKKVQVDVRLDEVVMQALEKEPSMRYQRAGDVKTAVETITGSRPQMGPAPGNVPPPLRPAGGTQGSDKGIVPTLILAIILGMFGAHRFYVGKIGTGILQLFTLGGLGIWWLVDLILIVCQAFKDGNGRRISKWFPSDPDNFPAGNPTGGGTQGFSSVNPAVTPASAISAPALALIIVAVYKLIRSAGLIAFSMIPVHIPGINISIPALVTTFTGITIISAALILYGGFQMLQLRSYVWSIVAAVLAIVSFSLTGTPVGIWALVILMRPGVKEAFSAPNALPSLPNRVNWKTLVGGIGTGFLLIFLLVGLSGLVFGKAVKAHSHNHDKIEADADNGAEEPLEDTADTSGHPEPPAAPAPSAEPSVPPATPAPPASTVNLHRTIKAGSSVQFSKTLDVMPGGKLGMDADRGDITITTWDRSTMEIKVSREIDGARDAKAIKILKEEDLEIKQDDGNVSIHSKSPSGLNSGFSLFSWSWNGNENRNLKVHYAITLPKKFDVTLETCGGDIKISDLKGTVDANTLGGDLIFGNIDGKVDGHTAGGAIKASGCREEIKVRTEGGDIQIKDFTGPDVQASTLGGSVSADFAYPPSSGCDLHTTGGNLKVNLPGDAAVTIEAETVGGNIKTDLPFKKDANSEKSKLHGTLNGGGTLIKLETMGGNIEANKR